MLSFDFILYVKTTSSSKSPKTYRYGVVLDVLKTPSLYSLTGHPVRRTSPDIPPTKSTPWPTVPPSSLCLILPYPYLSLVTSYTRKYHRTTKGGLSGRGCPRVLGTGVERIDSTWSLNQDPKVTTGVFIGKRSWGCVSAPNSSSTIRAK